MRDTEGSNTERRLIPRKDGDGHRYLVPPEVLIEFDAALNKIYDAHFGSADYYEACDQFNARFGELIYGGGDEY